MPLIETFGSGSAKSFGFGGIAFPPGTEFGLTSISNETSGIYGRRVNGAYSLDPAGLANNNSVTQTNVLTSISDFTSNSEQYSWKWLGYFKPNITGTWNFYTSSDDGSFLWLGSIANSGFTMDNATVDNRGDHGNTRANGSKFLVANTYYYMRVHFSENAGGDIMTLGFTPPGGAETTNGSGYYFYNSGTNGF